MYLTAIAAHVRPQPLCADGSARIGYVVPIAGRSEAIAGMLLPSAIGLSTTIARRSSSRRRVALFAPFRERAPRRSRYGRRWASRRRALTRARRKARGRQPLVSPYRASARVGERLRGIRQPRRGRVGHDTKNARARAKSALDLSRPTLLVPERRTPLVAESARRPPARAARDGYGNESQPRNVLF